MKKSMLEVENDAVKVMEDYGWELYRAVFNGGKGSIFQFSDLDGSPVELTTAELITKAAKVLKGEFGNKVTEQTGMKVTKHKPSNGVTRFELKW